MVVEVKLDKITFIDREMCEQYFIDESEEFIQGFNYIFEVDTKC